MKIRKAKIRDLNEISKIAAETIKFHRVFDKAIYSKKAAEFYPKHLKKEIQKSIFFVAQLDKNIVGYIYGIAQDWYPGYKIGIIVDLAVQEDYHGKGIGKMLLKTMISTLKKKRCKKVMIQVELENKRAFALYRYLGFKPWKYHLMKSL